MKRRTHILLPVLFALSLIIGAVSLCHSASLLVTWNANTESDLAGYNLYYIPAGITGWTMIDVGNVTTYTVVNVSSGVNYCVKLTARDLSGNISGQSDIVCLSGEPKGIIRQLLNLFMRRR